jgi:hypothetical protein
MIGTITANSVAAIPRQSSVRLTAEFLTRFLARNQIRDIDIVFMALP